MAVELLDRKSAFDEYLQENDETLSAFNFTNIFVWKDFFTFEFKVLDGNLCVFARDQIGCFLYLPPLGQTISPLAVEQSFAYMERVNQGSGVSRIENVSLKQLNNFPETNYKYFQKAYEYLYYRKDLAGLAGNVYKSKRWLLNNFQKNNEYSFVSYSPQYQEDCLRLFDQWAQERTEKCSDDIYQHMLKENRNVHRLILQFADQLGLVGRVIMINRKIAAYSFGVEINRDTFCVLVEVTDLNVKGLSVGIFHNLCNDPQLASYKFINVMDDFELENIQWTKNSFRPIIMMPSYSVSRK
ncbi:MAG: hypothetical protein KC733_06395 [Candidatus Omnitrophica bacterium]|nr:hypothetical protein [Candidatus Omnitrophota bacterium]